MLRWWQVFSLLLTLAFGLIAPPPVMAAAKKFSLEVHSSNSELNMRLQEALEKYEQRELSESLLKTLTEAIYAWAPKSGYHRLLIENFDIESPSRLIISLTNVERYRFDFSGVSPLRLGDLLDQLKLSTYRTSHPEPQLEIAQKIRNFYIQRGYAGVNLQIEVARDQFFEKSIYIRIKEGPLYRFNKIKWIGPFSKSEKFYDELFYELSTHPLLKKNIYIKEDIEKTLRNIQEELVNQAHLEAQVQLSQVLAHPVEPGKMDLVVLVVEGEASYLDEIAWEGNKLFSNQELMSISRLYRGQPAQPETLEKSLSRIKEAYQENGYLNMQFKGSMKDMIVFSEDLARVKLQVMISEGEPIRIGKITIEGNEITKDQVILKELAFKTGDLLTQSLLKESQERMYMTGLFSQVEIKWQKEENEYRILVEVKENEPGLMTFGIGAHNERGLTARGYAGVGYQNLQGLGRSLRLRVEGQYNLTYIPFLERSIQLLYRQPYLLDTRVNGRVGVNRSMFITDFNQEIASEANRTQYILDYPWTSRIHFTWQILDITTFRDFAIKTNQDTATVNIGSTLFRAQVDERDHPFLASRGYWSWIQTEYAHPSLFSSDWVQFYKHYLQHSHYFRFGNTAWSMALQYRRGLLNHDHGYRVPYDKVGFFVGGQNSMRGFTLDEVFPNTLDLGGNNYQLNGRAQLEMIKTELRFPLPWENVLGALFMDQGRVWFEPKVYDSFWRRSAGISLRYQTPIGAVAIEYGWKLPPQANRGESPGALHLAIGTF